MDVPVEFYARLRATPGAAVGWLYTLIDKFGAAIPRSERLIFGPHTYGGNELAPFETVALYLVDKRAVHDIDARQVVLSVTFMPLSHPEIGLDLRVWPLFPATLETLKFHFFDYFTQASPVSSSAAALYHTRGVVPLACNRWLLEQFETDAYADLDLSDPADAFLLYPAWLEQYRALRGEYPADIRRGYRALLTTMQRRAPKETSNKSIK